MNRRTLRTWVLAVGGAALVAATMNYAVAQNGAPKKDPRVAMTAADLEEANAKLAGKMDEERQVARAGGLDMKQIEPSGETKTVIARIERVFDGVMVYSIPYDRAHERELRRVGWRMANRAEHATDGMLFDGRAYYLIQTRGISSSLVGNEAEITLQSNYVGQTFAVAARVKR